MDPQTLFLAKYRGAPFFVSSTTTTGGRKVVAKQFINSDLQLVEDLGLLTRGFTLTGTVSERRNNVGVVLSTYQQIRDALLAALELGGPGILIHPFFGRIENVVVVNYTFTENATRIGSSPIEITFAISNTAGRPVPQKTVLGEVRTRKDAAADAIEADVADRFSVTAAFTGNFGDALDKVNAMVDVIEAATSPLAIEADALDEFNSELSDIAANAASLVDDPVKLADSIKSIFLTLDGIYPTAQGTFDALERLFDFGDGDAGFALDTSGRIERQRNREVLDGAVQSLALAYAYLNAAQLDLPTVEDVDEVAGILEVQYQKSVDGGTLDSSVEEELTKQRITTNDFFDGLRVIRPRIIEVETPLTATRLLAYQYYGSSDLGDAIAGLNELDDSAFIEGTVKVLSA